MTPGALIATPVLIFLTGCFVATEFAAVRVRSTQLEAIQSSDPRAAQALEVHRHLDRHLSSIQVAITLLTISLGAVGEKAFVVLFNAWFGFLPWPRLGLLLGTGLGLIAITLAQVVLAELLPRSAAIRAALPVALATAGPLLLWSRTIAPITWVLMALTRLMERILGMEPQGHGTEEPAPSQEEFRRMLVKSEANGEMATERKELIENVFDFSKRTTKEIAVPRAQVVFLDLRRPCRRTCAWPGPAPTPGCPWWKGTWTTSVGIIHMKELLWALHDRADAMDLRSVGPARLPGARDAPDPGPAPGLPEEEAAHGPGGERARRRGRTGDPGGRPGGAGGGDPGRVRPGGEEPNRTRGGAWVAQGTVTLDQLEAALGLRLEAEAGSVSLGGFFQERLGRVLKAGDELRLQDWRIRVLEMRGMAPRKFLLKPNVVPDSGPEPGHGA